MRQRRYKAPNDDLGWHQLLAHEVMRELKEEIREVPKRCTAKPPDIRRVVMIHGLMQRVEDICVMLRRKWD